MKKLLSLLSVLTISGTAVPTTIVASPYQKEEKLDIIKRNVLTNTSFAKKVNGLPENEYLGPLEVLSNDTVYVGVGNKLYKSNDLITFNRIGKDINNKFNDYKNISAIAIAPNGTLFVGTTINGLYKSTDGITFNKVSGIIGNENIRLIKITKYNVIYVGTWENGLYKSDDNGVSFNKLNIPSKETQYWSIDIHPKNGSLFVIRSSGFFNRANLYKSNDGNSFVEVNGIPAGTVSNEIKFLRFASNGDIYINVDIQNRYGNIWGGGPSGVEIVSKLYKSSDSFNFSEVTTLPSNIWVESFAVEPNGDIYIGTRPGGLSYISAIYKSQDNGKSFNKVNGIPEEKGVASIIVSSNGAVYAGLNREIYKSTDGNNFEKIIGAEVEDIAWNINFSSNEKILYIKTDKSLYYININNQLLTNEIFEKWYEPLEHDKLKVKFNFDTINKIKDILNNNKKEESINKLKLIITNISKSDHSEAGGSITNDDVNVIAIFIWEHYSYFNEKRLSLNNNKSIIIETNTIGYFDNTNPNNSIYIN